MYSSFSISVSGSEVNLILFNKIRYLVLGIFCNGFRVSVG